jgi:hypothetical protein
VPFSFAAAVARLTPAALAGPRKVTPRPEYADGAALYPTVADRVGARAVYTGERADYARAAAAGTPRGSAARRRAARYERAAREAARAAAAIGVW